MSTTRFIPLIDDTFEMGIDEGKFVETLGDSLLDMADFKIGSTIKKLTKTVKKKEGLQDKAFELVFNSLHAAANQLIKTQIPDANERTRNLGIVKHGFRAETRNLIDDLKTGIEASFFTNPVAWPFLTNFRISYSILLQEGLNVESHSIERKDRQYLKPLKSEGLIFSSYPSSFFQILANSCLSPVADYPMRQDALLVASFS